MKNIVELSLYVNGMNSNSNTIYTRLTKQCEDQFGTDYSLNLYDLKKDPAAAVNQNIMATPTLIRISPLPQLRVTGNLTNMRNVMLALKLLPGKIKGF
ncbi:MAG: circadian clock protein KaiB [Calditrichaeota bacterium]|nr:MAG: circadian clock protein KaiB [Calditrichota bacterium]MBL1206014.1 circadian clock protein KaiB [Calditrichota bacterium]NOG45842.1 circadian clock protein KaiB [Calditrichota bacterium]